LLCVFACTRASEFETFARDDEYKEYFEQQKVIYEGLLSLGIPGACPLDMDEVLAESVLALCPDKVRQAISKIKQRIFFKNKKNIIFHGVSGTGKSALAQAMAIQCQLPCLLFDAGDISTEYMNSGVQNLNRIFEYVHELEQQLGKPCVVIFEELESLTKKHADAKNPENNILMSFWRKLDKLAKSQVVVVGTMNNVQDVPKQIINRTYMIEIPLPTQNHREAVLSYHLHDIQNKYNLAYPEWLTAAYLAKQTKGFSNRDLENLVTEALSPALIASAEADGSNRMVKIEHVSNAIKQIKQDFTEEHKRTFKKYLCDSKILIPLVQIALTTVSIGAQLIATRQAHTNANMQMNHSLTIAERQLNQAQTIATMQMDQARTIAQHQMDQTRTIAEQQMSTAQIIKTAGINTAVAAPVIIASAVLATGCSCSLM
jgi:hypothetical protein